MKLIFLVSVLILVISLQEKHSRDDVIVIGQETAIQALVAKGARIDKYPLHEENGKFWSIDLTNAMISDDDAKLLDQIKPVKSFRLPFENVVPAKVLDLALETNDLEDLMCCGNMITDASLAKIGQLQNLFNLNLEGAAITDKTVARIKQNKELHRLVLAGTAISNQSLEYLMDLVKLKELHLQRTRISDDGLKFLAKMKSLEYVNLGETQITNEGFRVLSGSQSITQVGLQGTRVDDKGMTFCLRFQKLGRLHVSGITDHGLKLLESAVTLKRLYIYDSMVSESAKEDICKKLPELRIYEVQLRRPKTGKARGQP